MLTTPPLSLSLPMNLDGRPLRGERVAAYFDNLLPDSDALRQRIRARFQTQSTDAFDLLEAIGRDCVGAVQLLPDGRAPEGVTRIDDAQIEALLRGYTSAPGSSVSSQHAPSSSSTCPPLLASLRSARIRSSRTFMPRTRPVSPEGQVMTWDMRAPPMRRVVGGRRSTARPPSE